MAQQLHHAELPRQELPGAPRFTLDWAWVTLGVSLLAFWVLVAFVAAEVFGGV